jgi:hypothetical protein
VEAQWPQSSPGQRIAVAAAERVSVQWQPDLASEYEVVIARELLPIAEPRQRLPTSGAIGTARTLPDLGVVRRPAA